MKIIITENQLKKIIDEVTIYESTEDYYDKIVNILEPPYFKNLEVMGIDEDHYKLIFSRLFNQPVSEVTIHGVFNSSDKKLYYEDDKGRWVKYEYDDNGNNTYVENSFGDWEVWKYDDNDILIYYEDSDGRIKGNRNNNLNESTEDYYDKIVNVLEPPYFQNLEVIGIDKDHYKKIFEKLFNQPIKKIFLGSMEKTIKNKRDLVIYNEDYDGYWEKREYNENGKNTYYEDSKKWKKREYNEYGDVIYYEDSEGNIEDRRNISTHYYDKIVNVLQPPYFRNLRTMGIELHLYRTIFSKLFNQPVSVGNYDVLNSNRKELYFETSDGYWRKTEYDINGKLIYFEDSNGYWEKKDYNENGKLIYFENSEGYWEKKDYDGNGNIIYSEKSDGFWSKIEYDNNNNNLIYYENSRGEIIDKRNNGNLNESVDNDRYYDKIINILDKPYFKNLDSMGITVEEYEEIFSRMFGEEVLYEDLMDSKYLINGENDIIYREDSNGFWEKYEYGVNEYFFENSFGYWFKKMYDTNGNEIYYEDSDGEIIDDRNNGNLNESTEDYYDKLLNVLEPPYFRNLETIGIPEDHYKLIFEKIFNQPVNVYHSSIEDINKNILYYENSNGYWEKKDYNENGKLFYFEDSNGHWWFIKYDDNGKLIYSEDSDGYIVDRRNNN